MGPPDACVRPDFRLPLIQYRRARRLVREWCNYDCDNCIALDDREECVCFQSFPYFLLSAGQGVGNSFALLTGRETVFRMQYAVPS